MGQNSLAIICIESSYGNKSIVNSMDSVLTFFSDNNMEDIFCLYIKKFLILLDGVDCR